jgi:hypothetical protein
MCAEVATPGLLDPCRWAVSAPGFTLTDGQTASGLKIVMAKGEVLTINVSDPFSLLASPSGPIDLNFEIQVLTAKGLAYSAPIQQSTAVSRVHAIAIPFDTPLSLRILAARLAVTDQVGSAVSAAATAVSVPAGTTATPITYTVAGTKTAPSGPVGATGVAHPATPLRSGTLK